MSTCRHSKHAKITEGTQQLRRTKSDARASARSDARTSTTKTQLWRRTNGHWRKTNTSLHTQCTRTDGCYRKSLMDKQLKFTVEKEVDMNRRTELQTGKSGGETTAAIKDGLEGQRRWFNFRRGSEEKHSKVKSCTHFHPVHRDACWTNLRARLYNTARRCKSSFGYSLTPALKSMKDYERLRQR